MIRGGTESIDAGKQEALALIHTAAALGYGPARQLIAQDFIRSRRVRTMVSVQDAMRDTLDAVATEAALEEMFSPCGPLRSTSKSAESATTFATHLIEIIRDGMARREISAGMDLPGGLWRPGAAP